MINRKEEVKFVCLYDCIKIVEGVNYFLILDLQRMNYFRFEIKYLDILYNLLSSTFNNFQLEDTVILEFYNYLHDNELIYLNEKKYDSKFKVKNNEVNNIISNIIIEYSNCDLLEKTMMGAIELFCRNYEIRISKINSVLNDVLKLFSKYDSFVDNLFIITDNIDYRDIDIEKEAKRNNIANINIFINYVKDLANEHCGVVKQSNFIINHFFYDEAIFNNSCLYKKLAIDKEGNIKNCPSMKEDFGNIHNTKLLNAIEKPNFKKYWNINKDKINICQHCEFRYICMDCRAYLEDPEDILSKPLKCGYNPFTGEWSDWNSGYNRKKFVLN